MPIVVAAAVWGPAWRGQMVLARCDNAAVVAIINKGQAGKQQGLAAGAEDQNVVGLEGGGFISASIGANKC